MRSPSTGSPGARPTITRSQGESRPRRHSSNSSPTAIPTARGCSWLLALPDASTARNLTLTDFWPDTAQRELPLTLRDVRVPAALTAAHRPAIDAFLDEMAQAVANRPKFAFHRDAFDAWYRTRHIDAWRDFTRCYEGGQRK
ncbi:hypothetical protein WM15_28425 [Burkholderia ubonensis]|nr:hypothetical protein WM15_28425 [Burkholderia ubonensis]